MKCDRLKALGKDIWAEVTFWVEVLAEYLGWDRSPFHWVFEQHEQDLAEAAHQSEIKRKQAKFFKTS